MFLDLAQFLDEPTFSIAILVAKSQHGSNHSGILTKENDEILFYHLAWHLLLERNTLDEINPANYFTKIKWVKFSSLTNDPEVAYFRLPAIIKQLKFIQNKNSIKIPYSINFRETKFTENGDLILGANENGLTCSTFIASFFSQVGRDLVDLTTWEARKDEDVEFKNYIVQMMKKFGVSPAHIANVVKEDICFRIKPEEIAVSSSREEADLPADFEFCSNKGAEFNSLSS